MPREIKIADFKPNARRLYQLLGRGDWIDAGVRVLSGEEYAVASCVTELQNAIYQALGPEAYRDRARPWPLEPHVADTLRSCMRDYPGDYASHVIARFLLRCGHADAEVIGFLNDWDGMMFRWRERGITVARVEAALRTAHLGEALAPAARAKIASWLADPAAAIEADAEIFEAILGDRCAWGTLRRDDWPETEVIFSRLFASLGSDDRIADAAQHPDEESDGGTVRFRHDGSDYEFRVRDAYAAVDVDALMRNFDAFMEGLGREERVFRVNAQQEFSREIGYFVVAEPARFDALARFLGFSGARGDPALAPTLAPAAPGGTA